MVCRACLSVHVWSLGLCLLLRGKGSDRPFAMIPLLLMTKGGQARSVKALGGGMPVTPIPVPQGIRTAVILGLDFDFRALFKHSDINCSFMPPPLLPPLP